MKKYTCYISLFLLLICTYSSCFIEDDFFQLDVFNDSSDEVFLQANGQIFDRVKSGESKIPEDEFEYKTLFHFLAVSIEDGSIKSEMFVTANEIEFYEWIISD